MSQPTVLITGTNRGIGLEYVKQYAEAGWRVHATVRHFNQTSDLHALTAQYANIQVHLLDVADINSIQALAQHLADIKLDVLISNAGFYPESRFGHTDATQWLQAFQVNTLASYYLAEAFFNQLRRSLEPKIIAMTSKMGSIDDNGSGSEYIYRTSKTALNMVVKSLSIDLKPHGICVAALHPGWVRTDMGGPHGLIDCATSVTGLRKVIAGLSLTESGACLAYDGKTIPW